MFFLLIKLEIYILGLYTRFHCLPIYMIIVFFTLVTHITVVNLRFFYIDYKYNRCKINYMHLFKYPNLIKKMTYFDFIKTKKHYWNFTGMTTMHFYFHEDHNYIIIIIIKHMYVLLRQIVSPCKITKGNKLWVFNIILVCAQNLNLKLLKKKSSIS